MIHTIRTRIENRIATIAANLANIRGGATIVKVAVWVGVALIYSHFVINFGYRYRGGLTIDLPSFYTASVATFKLHQSPYSLATLNQIMDQQVFYYLYPPPSLLVFYPLSLVSFPQAQLLMLGLNHGLVLLSVYLIIKVMDLNIDTDNVKIALLCGCFLLSYPLVTTITQGQVGLMLLVLLLAFWRLAQQHRPVLAGAMLAVTILLKVYPVVLLPLLLIVRRYRETAATLVWIALISVGAGIILPTALWSDWFFKIISNFKAPALPPNLSIQGFFVRIFTDTPLTKGIFAHVGGIKTATICTYITAAILITISLVALTKGSTRSATTKLHNVMMVGLPLTFLIAPLSWFHHVVHLIPSLFGLWIAKPSNFPSRMLLYRAGIGIITLILIFGELLLCLPAVIFIWLLHIGLVLQPEGSFTPLPPRLKKRSAHRNLR